MRPQREDYRAESGTNLDERVERTDAQSDDTRHEKITDSVECLRILFESAPDAIYLIDLEGHLVDGNRAAEELIGYERRELIGRHFLESDLLSSDQHEKASALLARNAGGEPTGPDELSLKRKDGTPVPVEIRTYPIQSGSRNLVLGIARDITQRKKADDELRKIEARQALVLNSLPMAFYIARPHHPFGGTWVSEQIDRITGFSPDHFITKEDIWESRLHPDDRGRVLAKFDSLRNDDAIEVEYRWKAADGHYSWFLDQAVLIRDDEGNPREIVGTWLDVTDRKRKKEEELARLKRARTRETTLVDLATHAAVTSSNIEQGARVITERVAKAMEVERVAIWLLDGEGKDLCCIDLFERTRDRHSNGCRLPVQDYPFYFQILASHRAVDAHDALADPRTGELRTGYLEPNRISSRLDSPIRISGEMAGVVCHEHVGEPRRWQEDEITFARQVADQVAHMILNSRRCEAEEALKEREEFLETILENIPDVLTIKDAKTLRILRLNKAGEQLLGCSRDELIGKTNYEIFPGDLAEHLTRKDLEALGSRELLDIPEQKIQSKNRGERILHTKKLPIFYDQGNPRYLLGISADITERKLLQKKLLQAQKMEAIGTLAGGIAHDFNNILAGIIGYTELSLLYAEQDTLLYQNLQEVLKAATRGKQLVQQILAFGRRGENELKPLELRHAVREALKLLRATLPATIEIQEVIRSESAVLADPTQIHQVLMNLCTNAVQAMERDGGVLVVEVTRVDLDNELMARHPNMQPGSYLKLTVTDTGHGMSPAVAERIFDPFFTTKKQGKGTGMGLSVVHGIVKNHGGVVTVYSEPGKGSTFNVFLPVIEQEETVTDRFNEELPRGTERILFVDDEQAVLDVGKRTLESLGYGVVTASGSVEALELFRHTPENYDLIIADMTMPHMTGEVLVKEITRVRPGIPTILCSGFSNLMDEDRGREVGVRAVLSKPTLRRELAEVVRRVLDS